MLGKLIDKFRADSAVRRLNANPIVQGGRFAINQYWLNNHEVIKDFTKEFVQGRAEAMIQKVIEIAASPDPRMANREALAAWTSEYGMFEVLVMEPPPTPDGTGLRGIYGVNGQLKSRLVELAVKNDTIRQFMHGFDEIKTWDDVWNPILGRYRVCYAWAHVHHLLRAQTNDFNKARDWFRPFLAGMCGWWQHNFDESLGLQSGLSDNKVEAGLMSLTLSLWHQAVMNGGQYPDLEWIKMIEDIGGASKDMKPAYK
jgi:hypothetical protein